jgi:hypothetical protein
MERIANLLREMSEGGTLRFFDKEYTLIPDSFGTGVPVFSVRGRSGEWEPADDWTFNQFLGVASMSEVDRALHASSPSLSTQLAHTTLRSDHENTN